MGIIKAVPPYCPDFSPDDFAGLGPWSSLRPCSPDGLPYLGRTCAYANFSLGPITGQLLATILSDEKPALELALLDLDRYV